MTKLYTPLIIYTIVCFTIFILNIVNVKWSKIDHSAPDLFLTLVYLCLVLPLHFQALVHLTKSLCVILHCPTERRVDKNHTSKVQLVICYNLNATSTNDIDQCLDNMADTFWNNVATNVETVVVSATPSPSLRSYEATRFKEHRDAIRHRLQQEASDFISGQFHLVDYRRLRRLWIETARLDGYDVIKDNADTIAESFVQKFLRLERSSGILGYCGNFQDLVLLSEGEDQAYSYTEKDIHGPLSRRYGESIFHETGDEKIIRDKRYDFTLRLRHTTVVRPDGVNNLLLEMEGTKWPRLVVLETRHVKPNPYNLLTFERCLKNRMDGLGDRVLGETDWCQYDGQGLINNQVYADTIIGSPIQLRELIPILATRGEIFESAILKPTYSKQCLLEIELENLAYYEAFDVGVESTRQLVLNACYLCPYSVGLFINILRAVAFRTTHAKLINRSPLRQWTFTAFMATMPVYELLLNPLLLLYIIFVSSASMSLHCQLVPVVLALSYPFIPIIFSFSKTFLQYIPLRILTTILFLVPDAILKTWSILCAVIYCVKLSKTELTENQSDFKTHNSSCTRTILIETLKRFAVLGSIGLILFIIFLTLPLLNIMSWKPVLIYSTVTMALVPLTAFLTSIPISSGRSAARLESCVESRVSMSVDTIVRRRMERCSVLDIAHSIHNQSTLSAGMVHEEFKRRLSTLSLDDSPYPGDVMHDPYMDYITASMTYTNSAFTADDVANGNDVTNVVDVTNVDDVTNVVDVENVDGVTNVDVVTNNDDATNVFDLANVDDVTNVVAVTKIDDVTNVVDVVIKNADSVASSSVDESIESAEKTKDAQLNNDDMDHVDQQTIKTDDGCALDSLASDCESDMVGKINNR